MSLCIAANKPGNFVIIAGDGRVIRGGEVVREDHKKLTRLTDYVSIYISGAQDYCEKLRKEIESKITKWKDVKEIARIVTEESRKVQVRFEIDHPYYLRDNRAAIAIVLAYFDPRKNECGLFEYCHTKDFVPRVSKGPQITARGPQGENLQKYFIDNFNPSKPKECVFKTFEYAESLEKAIGGVVTMHVISKNGIEEFKYTRENVALGENVLMGQNATISWNQVTSKPDIPTVPGYIKSTYIDAISIQSPNIYGGTIAIGSNNDIFKADTNGIYLGHATFANANFSVSMDGTLTAKNGKFQGTIDSSTITGSTIRTAATNADRIELSGSGLISKNAYGEKHGLILDSGNFSSLDFYYRDELRGSLTQAAGDLALTTTAGSIIIEPSTYGSTVFRGDVDFTEANVKGVTSVYG